MKSKVVTMDAAMAKIESGMTIMIPGFITVGTPIKIVQAICEKGLEDFHLISIDAAKPDIPGIGRLITERRVRELTVAHIGLNPEAGRQMNAGELKINLTPMGSLAEKIRIGGAGIGGFLTPTGLGTVAEEGKQIIEAGGKKYLLELPLRADVAVLKAWKADTMGNLVYRRTARNFNPLMAMAADWVIAEAEHIVSAGELDPDIIVTPGIVVDMVVQG